jgi:uncharacterized protein (TIRG00374 family)
VKRILLGLLLGLLVLAWIARQVDARAVLGALAEASPALLAATMALAFVALWLKGERWAAAMAAPPEPPPRRRLFASMLIGTAGNIAMPARLGDFVRAFVLRRHNGVPVSRALAASWSVQVLDFLAVALLLWSLSPVTAVVSRRALALVAAAAAGTLVALAAMRRYPAMLRPLERLPQPVVARLRPVLREALAGLAFLDSPRKLLQLIALTAAVWLVESAAALCCLRAFALGPPLAAGPLLAAAIGLSFVLPLTPGSLGAYQLAAIVVLGAYGVDRGSAFAFGLGFQAVSQLGVLATGFLALQREGLTWRGAAEERARESLTRAADSQSK